MYKMMCHFWHATVDLNCNIVTAGCIHLGNVWQHGRSGLAVPWYHSVCPMEAFIVHSRRYIIQRLLAKVTSFEQSGGNLCLQSHRVLWCPPVVWYLPAPLLSSTNKLILDDDPFATVC